MFGQIITAVFISLAVLVFSPDTAHSGEFILFENDVWEFTEGSSFNVLEGLVRITLDSEPIEESVFTREWHSEPLLTVRAGTTLFAEAHAGLGLSFGGSVLECGAEARLHQAGLMFIPLYSEAVRQTDTFVFDTPGLFSLNIGVGAQTGNFLFSWWFNVVDDSLPPGSNVYYNDRVIYLNGHRIQSYVIGGRYALHAESLAFYGFNIYWDSRFWTFDIVDSLVTDGASTADLGGSLTFWNDMEHEMICRAHADMNPGFVSNGVAGVLAESTIAFTLNRHNINAYSTDGNSFILIEDMAVAGYIIEEVNQALHLSHEIFTGDIMEQITRSDSDGNTWQYSIVSHKGAAFLVIEDINRGYRRTHSVAGERAFEFTDEGIWFVTEIRTDFPRVTSQEEAVRNNHGRKWTVTKIRFDSKPETQGGTVYALASQGVFSRSFGGLYDFIISDGALFFVADIISSARVYAVPLVDGGQSKGPYTWKTPLAAGHRDVIRITNAEGGYVYFTNDLQNNATAVSDYMGDFKIRTDGTGEPVLLGTRPWESPWEARRLQGAAMPSEAESHKIPAVDVSVQSDDFIFVKEYSFTEDYGDGLSPEAAAWRLMEVLLELQAHEAAVPYGVKLELRKPLTIRLIDFRPDVREGAYIFAITPPEPEGTELHHYFLGIHYAVSFGGEVFQSAGRGLFREIVIDGRLFGRPEHPSPEL